MKAATCSLPDMGEWNITSQIKIDGEITPDFSFDWEVVFRGHKYIHPLRKPQGSKENTSLSSVIDLTFQHWAIYQLKRWYFFTIQPTEAGTAWPDKYDASVSLNLGDFCDLFGQILEYYYGDTITIELNKEWQYKIEPEVVSINHSHIWDVLIKLYEIYSVRWVIEPNGSHDKYVIKVGYDTTEQNHIFEYGFEGGLLKVERQVQSEEICNMIIGRGGEKNLPYRYFKNIDPENPSFNADPDWIEELKSIYFSNLMPATFRSYVQGWKAAHISKYPGYTAVGEENAFAPWAYRKGYTDAKFDPVEYVADKITVNPEEGDIETVISPTYSPYVKKGSSIAKYGPILNGLDNNEDIYPTIQGIVVDPYGRIDEAVYVEQIESDDVEEAVENDAQITDILGATKTDTSAKMNETIYITLDFPEFTVEEGMSANIKEGELSLEARYHHRSAYFYDENITDRIVHAGTELTVINVNTGETRSASDIPAGKWRWKAKVQLEVDYNNDLGSHYTITITAGYEAPKLESATINSTKWVNTFDILVKNIWGTSKLISESDIQYAERVWGPILGDRAGNEAKVVFSSGNLAHEDYEFVIVATPKYERKLCTWTTVENGVNVPHEYYSEWRLTLAKTDADMESLGVYQPSTMRNGNAGDFFFFIGIDPPHLYTTKAEERVDYWKEDALLDKGDIKPTWVVQTDRVRLNNEGLEGALINKLHPGDTLRLADKRFIDGDYETLYLSSLTITYREPSKDDAALNPDVEIVLSDHYEVSASPVATLQSEVSSLSKQIGALSNIEQIIRAVGDKLYLRKDGISDRSLSPTAFASLLTSLRFRSGIVGGSGWGIYKDAKGNWVIETDRLVARQDLSVNSLVINQTEWQSGEQVESAAGLEITRVEDTEDGYKCYFDQKNGSIANLFKVDDVAYCNRFTPENEALKTYRRRVMAVEENAVILTKGYTPVQLPDGTTDTGVNGEGVPEDGDTIIQRGSYTDPQRQFIKVRDVIGGGFERYIEGLNSVNAEGVEYYFVGRQIGLYNGRPRWFIGDDNGFIEWVNGVLNIKGRLSLQSTIGDQSFEEYIKQVSPPVEREDIEDYVNAIVDPKITNIQKQVDGVIETWFQNGVPTLDKYPANEWKTEAEKEKHSGDLYYDNTTGTAYRFSKKEDGSWYWNTITDEAITKALAAARQAQDTADGKRRIFIETPKPPYDEGDLWVNATWDKLYSNDILRCVTAKTDTADKVSFNINDWTLASKYTDDTLAQEAIDRISGYEYLKKALGQDTDILGGLIMTSLMSLGYSDALGRHTYAGMNGSWIEALGGKTIASWWGGEMVDKFYDELGNLRETPLTSGCATSLLRMDGSAYWANGNIQWDKNGLVTFGNGVKINIGDGDGVTLGDLNNTLESLLELINGLANNLMPMVKGEDGNFYPTTWDAVSRGTNFDAVKSVKGLYSEDFLASHGGPKESGSGGTGGGIDEEFLAAWLVENGYATQNWVTGRGYLTSAALTPYLTKAEAASFYQPKGNYLTESSLAGYAKTADVTKMLTIQRNGALVGTYNGTAAATLNISVPTNTNELTNGAGFITAADGIDRATSLINTGSSNPSTAAEGLRLRWYSSVPSSSGYAGTNYGFPVSNNANGILWLGTHSGPYGGQLGVSSNGKLYYRYITNNIFPTTADGGSWKQIAYTADLTWANILSKPAFFDANVLKNYYTSRPTSANVRFDDGGLRMFKSTTSMTTGKPMNDGSILSFAWDNTNGYEAQVYVPINNASMQYRMMTGGTWGNWITLLDTANLATHLSGYATTSQLANYVTLDTAQTIKGVKTFDNHINLGVNHYIRGIDETAGAMLYFDGTRTIVGSLGASTTGNTRIRSRNAIVQVYDGTNSYNILHTGNYASTLDSRYLQSDTAASTYVKKAGDTMTGPLTLPTSTNFYTKPGLVFNDAAQLAAGTSGNFGLYAKGTIALRPKSALNVSSDNGINIDSTSLVPSTNTVMALGGVSNRWTNVYSVLGNFSGQITSTVATGTAPLSVTSTTLVNNFNADMLDGYHEKAFMRKRGEISLEYVDNESNQAGAAGFISSLALGIYKVPRPAASEILVNLALNEGSASALQFLTTYSASGALRFRKIVDNNRVSGAWTTILTDRNIGSYTAGKATQLATARTLWGQSFDGSGNVKGDLILYDADNFNADSSKLYFRSRLSQNNGPYIQGLSNGGYDKQRIGIFQSNSVSYDHVYTEVVSILPTGNVGFGTTSPAYKVDVSGIARVSNSILTPWVYNPNADLRLGDEGNNYYVALVSDIASKDYVGAANKGWRITPDGSSEFYGNMALQADLIIKGATLYWDSANGGIRCDKGFYSESYISSKGASSTSDMRLKRVLKNLGVTVDDIAQAPAIVFAWLDGSGEDFGSSAQYWEHKVSQAVKWSSGYRTLAYDKLGLVAGIINSREIIHHRRKLDNHESRMQRLERENKELKHEIAELRTRLSQNNTRSCQ